MAARSSGVEIRFSVKDFESVVAALRATGAEGDAMARKLEMSGRNGSRGLNAIDATVAGMRDRARALTGELGLVGTALQALGPWGLAAGASIGALVLAFMKLNQIATEFGDRSQKVRDAAELYTINTDQLQAIKKAADDVSVGGDKIDSFLGRFSTGMEELRRGEGELLKGIRRTDPALAERLAKTRDLTTAIDLLAQAYAKANAEQKNELVAAAAGRRNLGVGLVLDQINQNGGVQALATAAVASGEAIDKELIQRLAKLKVDIDNINTQASNKLGTLVTEPMLNLQKQYAQVWLDLLTRLENFKMPELRIPTPSDMAGAVKFLAKDVPQRAARLWGLTPPEDPTVGATERGLDMLRKQMPGWDAKRRTELAGRSDNNEKLSPAWDLNRLRDEINLLGNAATMTEQLRLKRLEVNNAAKENGVNQGIVNRAMSEYEAQMQRAIVAQRERLGVVREEELLSVKMRELDKAQAEGFITNAQERAAAEANVRREIEDTMKQQAIRNSSMPQLTRMAVESGDLARQIDGGLSTSVRSLASDFGAAAAGTQKWSDVLPNLKNRIISMTVEMATMRAMAAGLSGIMNGFGGMTSGFSLPSFGGIGDLFKGFLPSAKGNVFEGGNVIPFARGGVVSRESYFRMRDGRTGSMSEGNKPEAIMPLTRLPSGNLGVQAAGGAAAAPVINIHNYSGEKTETRRRSSGGTELIDIVIGDVRKRIARGDMDDDLKGRLAAGGRVIRR